MFNRTKSVFAIALLVMAVTRQAEAQAAESPGGRAVRTRYPEMLRQANVEGLASMQVVLDSMGTPVLETY